MASKRLDPNASLADYKEHVARKQPMGNTKPKEHSARKTPLGNTKSGEHLAQKRTKIDTAIANAQAFQKQRTALINMSTKEKAGMALEVGIVSLATGMGNPAIQSGVRSAVNKVVTQPSNRIGRAMADSAFDASMNRISKMPLNPGNQIKGTRGTVVTPGGVSEGTSTFRVTPSRTTSQMEGTIKGQVTRASKEASKIGAYSSLAAKTGIKIGGAGGAGAGALVGYLIGSNKDKKK